MAELLADFVRKQFVPQPYLIGRGVLPLGGKVIMAGSPKTGKSFVALNLMLDLVRGRDLFGAVRRSGKPLLPVNKPWRVLYMEQELGEQGLLERLRGKEGKPGLLGTILPDGLELFVQPRDTTMRLDHPDGERYIRDTIKAIRPHLTVMDPMAKFHVADENSVQEMGAVMRVLDHVIEDLHGDTSVLLVHHVSKPSYDQEGHPTRRGGDRIRGSSAIWGDVDTLIEVQRKSNEHHPEPVLEMSFEMRRGEPLESIFVQRKRDGTILWMGDDFTWPTESSRGPFQKKFARY